MAKKETKEKSYNIKVPVYTTTMLDQTVGLFFVILNNRYTKNQNQDEDNKSHFCLRVLLGSPTPV